MFFALIRSVFFEKRLHVNQLSTTSSPEILTHEHFTLPEMTDKMADAVTRCIVTEHLKMARTLQENVWSGGQN